MYHELNIGIDMGSSKFLTENTAYFLGLLLADESIALEGRTHWIAPVRHNPKKYDMTSLEHHYYLVKSLSEQIGKENKTFFIDYFKSIGVKFSKFNAGKYGFVTLFEQTEDEYTLEKLVDDIFQPLKNSSHTVLQAFLVGCFDGRSSYDKTYKFISLDIQNQNLFNLIAELISRLGIKANLNNSHNARKRNNSGSTPRAGQIRIKSHEYLENIGFISPIKFENAVQGVLSNYQLKTEPILNELKTIVVEEE
ncbi:hypothetical protein ABID56_001020 [Alkalibacillus flavidus]|uniref:Homing endonuclease LAGLIDADG domain-containing protein n=1 Tax=Alkalibacillus flavidus TaxID=546021 RepID=A0ABV2KWJ8_9BACI